MYRFGYQIIFGKYPPDEYLNYALLIEKYGFYTIWVGDHFHPWFHTNASGGFPWLWIALAAERTSTIKIGTAVTAPIFRYHPAIVAQAFATMGYLHPGRIILGVGTGEAMNEVVTGHPWPKYRERLERLEEAIKIIKILWAKDFVTFEGRYYKLREANLYLKPKREVPLYVAAHGPKVAELAGKYADGLIMNPIPDTSKIFSAFKKGAENSERRFQEVDKVLTTAASYHEDYDIAMNHCKSFAHTLIPELYGSVYDPRELEKYASRVSEKHIAEKWIVASSVDGLISRMDAFFKMGFSHINIVYRGPDEEKFLRVCGEKVIPYFKS